MTAAKYTPLEVERKWQEFWEKEQTFRVPNPGEAGFDATKKKYYILDMFPYPSGAGLHVGHPEGYTATDILARWKRMQGFNVLHPMGWDAYGLPAEQYAVQTGTHPAVTTKKNVANIKRQIQSLGFSYDWSREIDTTDPKYYRWTQWIFLKLFNSIFDTHQQKVRDVQEIVADLKAGKLGLKNGSAIVFDPAAIKEGAQWNELSPDQQWKVLGAHRLAYVSEAPVWWCEALGTVLANEEVIDGRSERGDHPCVKKPLRQWMLRITAYAERLMADLESVDWPEPIKLMQRHWIGRSEGAEVDFEIADCGLRIADWNNATLACNDTSNIWQTSGGNVINSWLMDVHSKLLIKFIEFPNQPTVEFLPFMAPSGSPGLKAVTTPAWDRIASNCSNQSVKQFKIQYRYVGIGRVPIQSEIRNPKSEIEKIRVFTTRPDTLYGATYMVLAPEHPLVAKITIAEQKAAVDAYVKTAGTKSDLARTDLAKDKSGVFTGAYAYNPVYEKSDPRAKIPIWIADYVLMTYGTGAIMAVPAHDERDAEFAVKFKLPIVNVVLPPDAWLKENVSSDLKDRPIAELRRMFREGAIDANRNVLSDPYEEAPFYVDDGIAINSKEIDGLPTPEAKRKITEWLESRKIGEKKITYRLRDWLFSRQRYWGEPFPIVWDEAGQPRALTEDALPVMLPEMTDFKPTGTPEPPLSKAKGWLDVNISIQPDGSAKVIGSGGVKGRRETNTMPQWAGSCWYYLRFTDANNAGAPFGKAADDYWMNVDLYVGGAEHAVLHLLYSRFWHKVLYDRGLVHTKEPFQKLFNQGLITAFAYRDDTGRLIPNDEIEDKGDGIYVVKATGKPATQIVAKMSKALKNVVNPDDVINEYGADTLRLYEMFMGPLDGSKPWNPRDVPGMFRFLRDCWKMIVEDDESKPNAGNLRTNLLPSASELIGDKSEALERDLHKTIKGVTNDFERMAFNTAISKLMVFKNKVLEEPTSLTRSQAKRFLLLLAPLAPHIAEELWSRLRHGHSLAYEAWPKYEEALTQDATKELAVQVNGKVKSRVTVAANAAEEDVKTAALEAVKTDLAGKSIAKVIVVPGRLVNIVVK